MEITNNRRRFIKGVSLFAAIAAGSSALKVANTVPQTVASNTVEPVIEDIGHLAPPKDSTTVMITGAYGKKPEPLTVPGVAGSTYIIQPYSNPVVTHQVAMTVGLDNRLWIKVGEEWKRVAIEG